MRAGVSYAGPPLSQAHTKKQRPASAHLLLQPSDCFTTSHLHSVPIKPVASIKQAVRAHLLHIELLHHLRLAAVHQSKVEAEGAEVAAAGRGQGSRAAGRYRSDTANLGNRTGLVCMVAATHRVAAGPRQGQSSRRLHALNATHS